MRLETENIVLVFFFKSFFFPVRDNIFKRKTVCIHFGAERTYVYVCITSISRVSFSFFFFFFKQRGHCVRSAVYPSRTRKTLETTGLLTHHRFILLYRRSYTYMRTESTQCINTTAKRSPSEFSS